MPHLATIVAGLAALAGVVRSSPPLFLSSLAARRDDPSAKIFYHAPTAAPAASASDMPPVDLVTYIREAFPAPTEVQQYADFSAGEAAKLVRPTRPDRVDDPLTDADVNRDMGPAWMLDTFYASLQTQYAHVLTHRPRIDCDHGRYIMVSGGGSGSSGGSTSATELKILQLFFQLDSNLTAITAAPASSSAPSGPADEASTLAWGFDEWEVTQDLLHACSGTSNVWRNRLDLSASPATVAEMQPQILEYAADLAVRGHGGVVVLNGATAWRGGLNEADARYVLGRQWLLQVRWTCQHAFDPISFPSDPRGPRLANVPAATVSQPLRMHFSIHIAAAAAAAAPLDYYADAANGLLDVLDDATPGLPQKLLTITIYAGAAQGDRADFAALVRNFTEQGYHTVLNLDTDAVRVFGSLVSSDINVLAPRSESSLYCGFNAHRLRLGGEGDWAALGPQAGFASIDATAQGSMSMAAAATAAASGSASGGGSAASLNGERARGRTTFLWRFLVEWNVRRAARQRGCVPRTLACMSTNPYLHWPLGPITAAAIVNDVAGDVVDLDGIDAAENVNVVRPKGIMAAFHARAASPASARSAAVRVRINDTTDAADQRLSVVFILTGACVTTVVLLLASRRSTASSRRSSSSKRAKKGGSGSSSPRASASPLHEPTGSPTPPSPSPETLV